MDVPLLKTALVAGGVMSALGVLGAQTSQWQRPPGHTQMTIWPGTPPGAPRGARAETMDTVHKLVARCHRPGPLPPWTSP